MSFSLRPYQKSLVETVWAKMEGGADTLLVLPTGGGKTAIFASLTNAWTGKGLHVWILVHRRELLGQASAALTRLGVTHGRVAPGRMMTSDLVQVASIDTLLARLDQLRPHLLKIDRVVIDEAHHAVAAKWETCRAEMKQAVALGVTATPYRADGRGLGTTFKASVKGPSVADLTAMGFLAPATIYDPPTKVDLSHVKKRAGDYVVSDLVSVMDRPEITLGAIEHYRKLCDGTSCVVFCASVDHAAHVAEQFDAAGYRAAVVSGKTPESERDAAIRGLASGTIQILSSCDIISEGTDIPVVGAAILLRPTESTGLLLQQAGRVLRPASGKERAIIIDEAHNIAKHGMIDAMRPWSLAGGIKGLERGVAATWRCRSCWTRSAAPERCPTCDRARPQFRRSPLPASEPAVVISGPFPDGGAISRFTDAQIAAMPLATAKKLARSEADLERVARARGYKPGWVGYVLAERGDLGRLWGRRKRA